MVDRAPTGTASPAPSRGAGEGFPCFDGMRALACFAILVIHAAGKTNNINEDTLFADVLARMEVALPVFFVVSGFLIYRPFVVAHLQGRPPLGHGPYLWRRALRAFPAIWLCFGVIYLVGYSEIFDSAGLRWQLDGPADVFWYFGLLWIYSPDHPFSPSQPAWTVCTEVAFYLAAPVIASVASRLDGPPERRMRAHLAAAAVMFSFSVIWQVWVLAFNDDQREMMLHWLPGWLDVVAMGMVLATISAWIQVTGRPLPWRLDSPRLPALCWVSVAACLVVLVLIDLPFNRFDYTPAELFATHLLNGILASALLLPAVFGPQDQGAVRRFLRLPVLAWLGLIAYGIYLWHEFFQFIAVELFNISGAPSFFELGLVLAFDIPVTVAVAAASYYFLERPALAQKDRVPGVLRGWTGRWHRDQVDGEPADAASGRGAAVLATAGSTVTGVVAPLVVYGTEARRNSFAWHHAREALNFQLMVLLFALIQLVVITLAGTVPGQAWFVLVLGPTILCGIGFGIVGALRAREGEWWCYPLGMRFVGSA